MIEFKLDFSDVQKMNRKLVEQQELLKLHVPRALNEAGRQLVTGIVREVSAETEIPRRAIRDGLDVHNATVVDPIFSVESHQHQFPYVTWVTLRDEKVCPICGPRDGINYREDMIMDRYPAHPNCRCELHPVALGSLLVDKSRVHVPNALRYARDFLLSELSNK